MKENSTLSSGSRDPSPRVGIGMPVYNGERYLEETIRATLLQTYTDFQLIIADNASTDKTEEICRDFATSDNRIKYIRNATNLGASKNYAVCFEPSDCEYFRWANADDLVAPTLLEKCVKVLDDNADIVLAYAKTNVIDENGKLLYHYDDNLHLPQRCAAERFKQCLQSIGLSNVLYGLIRREYLANTALLGNYIASDINLIAELTLYGRFYEIQEHLFSRRMHPQASSWDRRDKNQQKEFWDPSKKRLVMQVWRSLYEYYKAVIGAPISTIDKRDLVIYLLKKTYWSRHSMCNEIVDLIRYGFLSR